MSTQPFTSHSEKAHRVLVRLEKDLHFSGAYESEIRIMFKVGDLPTINGVDCEVEAARVGSEEATGLFRYLQKELQLPECCIQFEIVFSAGELLTVEDLEYYPQDDGREGGE